MRTVTTLPGLKEIYRVRASMVPPLAAMKSAVGISVYMTSNVVKICTEGNPSVEIVDEQENNGRQVQTTLRFESAEKIETRTKYAFIYVDQAEEAWLVGSKEKPYPTISKTQHTGIPGQTSAVISYEVKWLSNAEPAKVHFDRTNLTQT